MKKYFLVIFLLIFSSCLAPSSQIMSDYKGKLIEQEDLIILELREKGNNYSILSSKDFSGNWNSGLTLSITPVIKNNTLTDAFQIKKDSLKFTPDFLDLSSELKNSSTFKRVINYQGKQQIALSKTELILNDDTLNYFLPATNQYLNLVNDSIKFILFLQFPEEVYMETGKIILNTRFCFWNNLKSEIISYGELKTFSTVGYKLNLEELKEILIKKVLINTPFHKKTFGRRPQLTW